MNKWMKKLTAALCAAVLMCGMAVTAYAGGGEEWDYKHFVLKKSDGIIYKGDFRLSDSFGTEFSPRWQCEGWLIDVLDPSTINYAYYRDITDEARQKAYTYLSSVGVDGITAESDPIIMLAKTKKQF